MSVFVRSRPPNSPAPRHHLQWDSGPSGAGRGRAALHTIEPDSRGQNVTFAVVQASLPDVRRRPRPRPPAGAPTPRPVTITDPVTPFPLPVAAVGPVGSIIAPLSVLLFWLPYRRGRTPWRAGGRPVPGWRQACYAAGLLVLALALSPPVDKLADELLVAHMAEHLLIGDLAALLIVLGFTGPLLAPLLRNPVIAWLRVFTHPVVAVTAWAINFYVWHLPALYQAALRHDAIHALEHATFLGLRDRGLDGPARAAAKAPVVRQRRPARVHHRGAADRDGAGQRDDLLGHASSTRTTGPETRTGTSARSRTRLPRRG